MSYWESEFRIDEFGHGVAHQHLGTLIKRGSDGQRFLDIFHPAWGSDFIPWTEFIPLGDTIPTDPAEFLKMAWAQIAGNRAVHGLNPKVLSKWEWLATECSERADTLGVRLS